MSHHLWTENWLCARSGAPLPQLYIDELDTRLGGSMSYDDFTSGKPPAPHNGWHGGPGDCFRSNCPAAPAASLCTCGTARQLELAAHHPDCGVTRLARQILGAARVPASRETIIAKGQATGHADGCRCADCLRYLAARHTCDGNGTPCEECERITALVDESLATIENRAANEAARVPASPATERVLAKRDADPGIPLWDPDRHRALAEYSGPMTLPEDKLPAYGVVPPGCCPGCHLPVPGGAGSCWYCTRLGELRKEQQKTLVPPNPVTDAEWNQRVVSTIQAARRAEGCRHGGGRSRWIADDGSCKRCGETVFRHPRPAPARRNYAAFSMRLSLMVIFAGLGVVLFISAAHGPLGLVVPALIFLMLARRISRNL